MRRAPTPLRRGSRSRRAAEGEFAARRRGFRLCPVRTQPRRPRAKNRRARILPPAKTETTSVRDTGLHPVTHPIELEVLQELVLVGPVQLLETIPGHRYPAIRPLPNRRIPRAPAPSNLVVSRHRCRMRAPGLCVDQGSCPVAYALGDAPGVASFVLGARQRLNETPERVADEP